MHLGNEKSTKPNLYDQPECPQKVHFRLGLQTAFFYCKICRLHFFTVKFADLVFFCNVSPFFNMKNKLVIFNFIFFFCSLVSAICNSADWSFLQCVILHCVPPPYKFIIFILLTIFILDNVVCSNITSFLY